MMTQKYFVTTEGVYIGSYDGPDEDIPPMFDGGIEVPTSPEDARQLWDFANGAWLSLPLEPYSLPVALFWLAMTDEEAENFDAAMAVATPLRLRRSFNTATSMMSDGELFAFAKTALKTVVTDARANEIMSEPNGVSSRPADAE